MAVVIILISLTLSIVVIGGVNHIKEFIDFCKKTIIEYNK